MGQIELPSPNPRAPEPGTIAAEVAVQVASSKQRILVRDTLHGAHALVLKTRDLFESARADDRGILHPDGRGYQRKNGALAIHVSKAQVHRGLRIFDALLKAIEANGWIVTCPAQSQNRGTGVKLFGEEIAISLEEKVKRFDAPKKPERVTKGYTYDIGRGPYVTIMVDPYPRYTYEPLGQFALRVPGYGSPSLQIADGTTQKLEERLAEFLIGVVRLAERQQDRRRRWEEEERQHQEALRRQQEAERRRAEERERVEALMRDATTWRRAEELRAYVAALRQKEPEISAERESYCIWALAQADSIDPLRRR